jgi:isopenicillin-N N-acyltransferase like protein
MVNRKSLITGALAGLIGFGTALYAEDPDKPKTQARPEPKAKKRADPKTLGDRIKATGRETQMELKLATAHLRGALRNAFRPIKPRWKVGTVGAGSLKMGPGKIPILRVKGSPEEMGFQQGKLLSHEIYVLCRQYIPHFLGKDYKKARKDAAAFWPYISKRHQRELKALAAGAKLPLEDILLGHTFADQYRAWACSCVTATGSARKEQGTPIFGRNLDFIDMGYLHRFSVVTIYEPDDGQRVVSIGFPGMIGVISGINESGLSAAVMVVHSDTGCKPGTPFGLLFREILETSTKVEDVGKRLAVSDITVTNNLMVADSRGEARVYELFPGVKGSADPHKACAVPRTPNRKGLLFSTNHFNAEPRKEPRLSVVHFSSQKRYKTLQKVVKEGKSITLETVKASLEATAPKTANVQAMVFLPAAKEVHVAFGAKPAAKRPFIRLPASLLFPKKK